MKTTSQSEASIQSQVIETLRKLGCIVIRHNVISPLGDGKFKKMSAYDRGAPDLIVLGNNQVVLIEMKAEKGKQSIYQKAFQKQCDIKNIKYIVCKSVSEAIENTKELYTK